MKAPHAPGAAKLRSALIAWFRRGHREMPWRDTKDPYAIWVSEIMLQQTRVETVRAYYTRWMQRLPTVRALAEAPLDEVLCLWSGLGYYARARNLRAAAQVLIAQDGGRVPRDPGRLRALPGIGAYTAGAIASIAFDLPEPILDGNVARILSRIYALDGAPEQKATREALWGLARALVPASAASDFNQAMMELGATVCTPRDPACGACPVARLCRARALGQQEELPRKKQRRSPPTVDRVALVVRDGARGKRLLLARRPPRGLWGGLWELPCVELLDGEAPRSATNRAAVCFGVKLSGLVALPILHHELTHRRYRFQAFVGRARGTPRDRSGGYDAVRWVDEHALTGLGLSAWVQRTLETAR